MTVDSWFLLIVLFSQLSIINDALFILNSNEFNHNYSEICPIVWKLADKQLIWFSDISWLRFSDFRNLRFNIRRFQTALMLAPHSNDSANYQINYIDFYVAEVFVAILWQENTFLFYWSKTLDMKIKRGRITPAAKLCRMNTIALRPEA